MNTTANFNNWLDIFLEEKGIDPDEVMEVEGKIGLNIVEMGVLLEHIKGTTDKNKAEIKNILVKIDFANGDVRHFLRHLAKAIAI